MENLPATQAQAMPIVGAENNLASYSANLEGKLQMCDVLLKSGVVPKSYASREAIFAVVMMGQEYGFGPMKSLELFDFIQGRACMRVAGMLAKAQQNGGMFKLINETEKECTIEARRAGNGWTETYTFTWEQAEKMGLTSKENWRKMPRFMLYARCASVLVRRGWADIMGGLYSAEEIEDSDVEPRTILAGSIAPDPVRMAETHKARQEQTQGDAAPNAQSLAPAQAARNYAYKFAPVKEMYQSMGAKDGKAAWIRAIKVHNVRIDEAAGMLYADKPVKDWALFAATEPASDATEHKDLDQEEAA